MGISSPVIAITTASPGRPSACPARSLGVTGTGVAVGDSVGLGVAVGDSVGRGVAVGDSVGLGVAVGDSVGRGVAVGVSGMTVGVSVGVSGMTVGVSMGVSGTAVGVSCAYTPMVIKEKQNPIKRIPAILNVLTGME